MKIIYPNTNTELDNKRRILLLNNCSNYFSFLETKIIKSIDILHLIKKYVRYVYTKNPKADQGELTKFFSSYSASNLARGL